MEIVVKRNRIGCFTFLALAFVFALLLQAFNHLTGNKGSESNITQNSVSHEKTDGELAKEFLMDYGINSDDYVLEDVSTSITDLRGEADPLFGNYENFTVEKINNFLNNSKNQEIKTLIESFGVPDTFSVTIRGNLYLANFYWQREPDSITNYVHGEISYDKTSGEQSVDLAGTPVDSISGDFKVFLGIDGVEFAD